MIRFYFAIVICFFLVSCASQRSILPDVLDEVSGVECFSRSYCFAVNDSGDGPIVYVMTLEGVVFHHIYVNGAKNVDWEDLSCDDQFLYLGDIGNNSNKRKNLKIYRIPISDVWSHSDIDGHLTHNFPDTVQASSFSFFYQDQKGFPPSAEVFNFDAESIASANGKLLILSKDRSKPYRGTCKIYEGEFSPGKLKLKLFQQINFKGVSWLQGSVTGCDYKDGKLYVLTYKRVFVLERENGAFKIIGKQNLGFLQQWEGISVESTNSVRIVAEKSRLGKQKMKTIQLKDFKAWN